MKLETNQSMMVWRIQGMHDLQEVSMYIIVVCKVIKMKQYPNLSKVAFMECKTSDKMQHSIGIDQFIFH